MSGSMEGRDQREFPENEGWRLTPAAAGRGIDKEKERRIEVKNKHFVYTRVWVITIILYIWNLNDELLDN